MINTGKHNLLGVNVAGVDMECAVEGILQAAQARHSFSVTALAVHGVMTGALDAQQRARLNSLSLVVPDGQPVRWGLNLLYHLGLTQRVYGPDLMLNTCAAAAQHSLPIYLYGNSEETLKKVSAYLTNRYPTLKIAGTHPSFFRRVSPEEQAETAMHIHASGAALVFIGLGCPRQEMWAYEHQRLLDMPIITVGAAFDFFAGNTPQAPQWMQQRGLEWLFRLVQEPSRLWKRYLLLNPAYISLFALQKLGLWKPSQAAPQTIDFMGYG